MKSLVIKDIRLTGILFKIFIFCMAIIYTTILSVMENIYIIFWGYLGIVLFFMGLIYMVLNNLDQGFKVDIVLNSLPIDKETIVKSRYVSIMVYILTLSLMIPLLSSLIKMRIHMPNGRPITIELVFYMVGITTLLYSIYLPIDFYNRGREDKVTGSPITTIGILVFIAVYSMRRDNFIYNMVKNIEPNKFPLGLIILSLLLYLLSLFISIKIYKFKEF